MTQTKPRPIAPLLTFFEDSGKLDPDTLHAHVTWLERNGIERFLVLGSTAETAALSLAEKRIVLETVIQSASHTDHIACLAGTCFEECVQLGREAQSLGYTHVLLAPPYHPRSASGAGRSAFVRELADAVDLPFLIYHFPAMFGGDLNELLQAAHDHPRFTGIKESSGQVSPAAFRERSGSTSLLFYPGGDTRILSCLREGAAGSITSATNVVPELVAALYEAVESGAPTCETLQAQLSAVREFFSKGDPQAVAKYVLDVRGRHGGKTRLPVLDLSDECRKEIRPLLAPLVSHTKRESP